MKVLTKIAGSILALCTLHSVSGSATTSDNSLSGNFAQSAIKIAENKEIYKDGYPEAGPRSTLSYTFEQLNRPDMRLRGVQASRTVDFTNRVDHIITDLSLDFAFTSSPALIRELSHIKVYLNEEVMATIPVVDASHETVNQGMQRHSIKLEPKFVKDFNTLRFELIGHYTRECEDPFHSSIWADISRTSRITFTEQQLPFESLLAQFPEPFFDERDYSQLNLPFVFNQTPDNTTLHAASILSSWFGAKANWRGATFPVNYNELPSSHSVVFATNDNRPDFLADYPDVEGPVVEVIANPEHRYQKLLLVLGRNSDDLKVAAEGLALGLPMMTGRTAKINKVDFIEPRKAYDAPRWIRSDRPVRFGELVEYKNQLQAIGYSAPPVKLDVRVAPDLFTWYTDGLPIELKYRYTPPTDKGVSRLNMSINEEYVQGYKLDPDEYSTLVDEDIRIPLLSTDDTDKARYFTVPGFKVAIKNDVAFEFLFSTEKEGFCQTTAPEGTIGAIDENSTIDVSGYHHYIAMPNLHAYAQGGFPFTKYADLSETLIVLPASPNRDEVETLLTATGHLGQTTGYPSLKATILTDNGADIDFDDKDILLIGSQTGAESFSQSEHMSVLINQSLREIKQAIYETQPYKYAKSNEDAATHVSLESYGSLAAIAGFQSPFNDERSVVTIMAASSNDLHLINDTLTDGAKLIEVQGTATIINPYKVHQSHLGERFYVGSLPLHTLIWFHLSDHPLLLAFMTIITLLILSVILWRVLNTLARKRVGDKED